MRKTRPEEEFWNAKALLEEGAGTFKVARLTGIPRSTLRYWTKLEQPPRGNHKESYDGWRPPSEAAADYSYLLGLYLGDGCLIEPGGNPRLVIVLDEKYQGIIGAAESAIRAVVPGTRVCRHHSPGAAIVAASHGAWYAAFPQHGPGRKHRRAITLTDWQSGLCSEHPRELIRGLVHSDGSRVINRFKTKLPSGRVAEYAYVRYFFTNYSEDIRRIFCEHCELLGIRWTQSSFKNISVAHRDSVAILDEFVGPKR